MNLFTAYFSLVAVVIGLVFLPKVIAVGCEILEPYIPTTMKGKMVLFGAITLFAALSRI